MDQLARPPLASNASHRALKAPFGYRPKGGGYDEMVLPSGELRPHWQNFGAFLQQATAADLSSRAEAVQRLLRDHGVTYNIYDDALGTSRPWALDLIPFIVAADEAKFLADGLEQRARLLDAILVDIYGPQRLIKDGWIPPALVLANPAFFRPLVGLVPRGKRFLYQAGCDLVRATDGVWRVLADRVQVPSGLGYALENRIIMTSVFAEEFTAARAQRVAEYFETEREGFRGMIDGRCGCIAMLAPKPNDENYFEYAFKARYLGFSLVESADLTVRDRRLYVKTLEGLGRVDVLLRSLDDHLCDPLELSGNASTGIPGLIEAWRNGSVTLVNGLGTGVVSTPALHPFMPGLCRHLLGEELKISCVPTWWCGQPRELAMVLADPQRWVIKEAFVRGARDPIFLGELNAKDREKVIARIKADPHLWVAQDALRLSTTPTWVNDHLEPRPIVWRAFMVADRESYNVMPGGLSRVSADLDGRIVTMRSGGISKDTWVLTDGAVVTKTLLGPQLGVINQSRPPSLVPSRVADHLFWLGRYAERLEQAARVARTALQRTSGEGSSVQSRELPGCLALLTAISLLQAGESASVLKSTLHRILYDARREGSLAQLIASVQYNAAAARDRLSDDTWRIFNRIERDARQNQNHTSVATMLSVLDTLILDLAAFSGMQNENMTHGHGWRFLELGRRIERALAVAEMVRASTLLAEEDDAVLWPLLEICDSTMTYRRLHFSKPQIVPTVFLLLQDQTNPRSIAYQLECLRKQVILLPKEATKSDEDTISNKVEAVDAVLIGLDWPAMSQNPAQAFASVPITCTKIISLLESLSLDLTEHYFSLAIRRVH